MKHVATLALLLCLPLLAACQRDADPAPPATDAQADSRPAPQTALGRTVAKAMDEARRDLHAGNLSLNGSYDVQINGKRRTEVTLPIGASREAIEREVLSLEAVARMLDGKPPKKLVIVPDRIVNVVV